MPPHPTIRFAVVLLGLGLVNRPPNAQDKPSATAPDTAPSLVQQIKELQATQQRILEELQEIKAFLQTAPRRSDYPTRPMPPSAISLDIHGEPFRGGTQAPVAIMEYSDFDCSFCARYEREIYPQLDANYIQPGKIKYFFRDLPAPEHTNSLFKARAARCAFEQGKFWQMHDALFGDQSASAGPQLVALAQSLGLDATSFEACLSSDRYTDAILRSAAGAKRMGLQGTPAFIIGTVTEDGDFMRASKVMIGAENYQAFQSVLDELLAAPRHPASAPGLNPSK